MSFKRKKDLYLEVKNDYYGTSCSVKVYFDSVGMAFITKSQAVQVRACLLPYPLTMPIRGDYVGASPHMFEPEGKPLERFFLLPDQYGKFTVK